MKRLTVTMAFSAALRETMSTARNAAGVIVGSLMVPMLVVSSGASAQNLLSNADFEDGLNGWSTSIGTAVYSVDTTTSHSGTKSAKGVETDGNSLGRLYQDLTGMLIPGEEYRISGWIRTESTDGCGAFLSLSYVDSSGWSIGGSEVVSIGFVLGTTDWTYFESDPVVLQPLVPGTVALWFLFDFCAGTGTAWFDDLSLELASPVASLIVDGGVEAAWFTGNGSSLTNVNADQVDGFDASAAAEANTLLALDGTGKLPADISGNAATASDADLLDGLHAADFALSGHIHETPAAGLVDGPHRRYVSSRGSDSNACTLAAPCRTFAVAILATDAGGEVVAIDSGDYGPFTVDKTLTIAAAPGVYAGIAVSTGAGVTVSVASADVVVLRGLTIHGTGGEDGVVVTSGGSLHVENCVISDFNVDTGDGPQGIDVATGRLFVKDTLIESASTAVRVYGEAYLDRVRLDDNRFFGLFVVEGLVTIRDSVAAGNACGLHAEDSQGGTAQLMVENSLATHNGLGVHVRGDSSVLRIAHSVVVNNLTGLSQEGSTVLLSRGDNTVEGNGTDISGAIGAYSPR